SSYQLAYQQRAQLRVRIQLATTPEFVHLPWEYLCDPVRAEFLALSVHSPMLRYMDLMHHILPLKVDGPLRMLVVIPAPAGYPAIELEREWHTLLDTLDHLALDGKLKLERLQKPTLFDLQRRLRQGEYHLLHFIGHTLYDPSAQDGLFVFEEETGRSRPVSGQHLGSLLRDHYALRLVVLQPCQRAQITMPNPYVAIAPSLVQRGLPAVVSLQFPINALAGFADPFYTAIANRQPVDVAVADARRSMASEQGGVAWAAPLLLMRTPDGRLFETTQRAAAKSDNAHDNRTRRLPFVAR
ncbi:MAG: CHAT domain-containing protein, partial [Chloroflexota bacterium]|nr:CHAT domain-containing protein [Chloroflexota bacterium]